MLVKHLVLFCSNRLEEISYCGYYSNNDSLRIVFLFIYIFLIFCRCYDINADLHIGITSSCGVVVEYDFNGLCDDKTSSWNESLCVYTLVDVSWQKKWDEVLKNISDKFRRLSDRYFKIQLKFVGGNEFE